MTSSTERIASYHLEALLRASEPDRLHALIDAPLDTVLQAFPAAAHPVNDVSAFHHLLAAFLQRVYAETGGIRVTLNQREAAAEAIALLESSGHGSPEASYHAVYLTARKGESGVREALSQVAGLVKEQRAGIYLRWLTERHCRQLEWREKVALTQLLLERLGPCLPAELHTLPAPQLAHELEMLLQMYLETCRFTDQPPHTPRQC